VLALARQLSANHSVGMLTNNPLLLKRPMTEVFPAVPDLLGRLAVFSAGLGRSDPDPKAFQCLACAPDGILYSDDNTSYVAGARRPGCRPIASAGPQACAPASPCMASSAGDRVSWSGDRSPARDVVGRLSRLPKNSL